MACMTDTAQQTIDRRHTRLNQVAAWVAIVAGLVFIVGAVFFSGYFLGRHSGGYHGWGCHRGMEMGQRGGPMMPMGPGPGMMGPGMGPGPAQPPSSPAPRP